MSSQRAPGWTAAACGLGALVLYAATVAHGVGWDDSGELAAGVSRLGIVHAPGYPLYVLLGWVFTNLVPTGSEALRANLWSCVTAAAAVAALAYLVAWRTRSVLAAVGASALLATGGLFWSSASQASTYPMFVLSVLLLLVAAYRWEDEASPSRLAWLAGAAGLVAVNNRIGFLFVAWVALYVVLRARTNLSIPALAAFFVPWLSLVYVALRADAGGFPNRTRELGQNWLELTTGSGQPGDSPFAVGAHATAHHVVNLGFLGVAELSVAALVLVPVGVWALRRDRVFLLCGLAPAVTTALIVATTFGAFAYWQLPALAVAAVAIGFGLDEAKRRLAARGRTVQVVAAAALVAACVSGPIGGVRYVSDHDPDASGWAQAVLAALPPHADIWAPWAPYTSLAAQRELAGTRTDVRVHPYVGKQALAEAVRTSRDGRPTYVVAFGPRAMPPGTRVTPTGPPGPVERKGLTGLDFASRVLGDPIQLVAQAYRVQAD